MSKIKLYTEEQVRRAIDEARLVDVVYRKHDELIELLTPIELPSEEDTEKHSIDCYAKNGTDYYVREGAKWVIEQIKQQDNGKDNTKRN